MTSTPIPLISPARAAMPRSLSLVNMVILMRLDPKAPNIYIRAGLRAIAEKLPCSRVTTSEASLLSQET